MLSGYFNSIKSPARNVSLDAVVLLYINGGGAGLMVSALVPGSSLGRGHCVVFLGKTLYSHSASLHPGV